MKKLLVGAVLLLAACSPEGTETVPVSEPLTWVQISGSNWYTEFKTEQGVPCIVVDGYQSVAVTCNWNDR